jgi:hypothetical protein
MEVLYVVIYDFHGKKRPTVIPETWIYPKDGNKIEFGSRRFLYHASDISAQPPSTNLLYSLVKRTVRKDDENKEGFVYPGVVLECFGKDISKNNM